MDQIFDGIQKVGGVVGIIALLTGGWQCWYASQFNEIEVLIAGNDWRRKRDLGIATFIFTAFLLSNCVMGMSMDRIAVFVFFGLTVVCWLAGLICAIVYHFKKGNNKIAHWANGTLFASIFFIVWIYARFAFMHFVSADNSTFATDKILPYIGVVALATLVECLCLLVLMRTIRYKSRVLLKLRQCTPKDKELFIYRRVGDDLICGTDADIYSAKDIVIVPMSDIKEKGYCYGYAATNSNEAGENKNGKKKKVVQIEADTVIVNESKNNISITDFKENTVVPHDKEGEGSEEKKDS